MATAEQQRLLEEARKSLAKLKADDFSGISKDNTLQGGKLAEAGTKLANKMIETGTPEQKVAAAKTQKTYLESKQLPKTPTTTKTLPTVVQQPDKPTDRVSNTVALSRALNLAVNSARKARQNQELDFLGGVLPGGLEGGSISASTFGSLLGNLNRASTQFTQPLLSDVMGAVEADQKMLEDNQNSIRDLALSLVENGASKEAVQGVLNAPDVDSAIGMAAGVLQADNSDQVIEKVGSTLVTYDPADPQGTIKTLFDASGSSGSTPSSSTTPGVSGVDFIDAKISDVKSQVKSTFAQDFANRIITELNDEQLRLFMNDFMEAQRQAGQSLNPEQYYTEWRAAAGLETEEETEEGVTNPWG